MWVAKQMGHSDWTMIARVYGRWMPNDTEDMGSKAVEMWSGRRELKELPELWQNAIIKES